MNKKKKTGPAVLMELAVKTVVSGISKILENTRTNAAQLEDGLKVCILFHLLFFWVKFCFVASSCNEPSATLQPRLPRSKCPGPK